MLKKGDTIKCADPEDLAQTFMELSKADIDVDFLYEKDGVKGYWLEVQKDEKENLS